MCGQGIAHGAAFEFSEFQQTIDPIRQLPLHFHGLPVKFRPGHQGIDALRRLGNVGGFSADVHIYLAGASHQLPGTAGNDPGFQPRPQMQAENGNTTADVWFGGGVDSYISAAELGYLEQYESPEAEAIDAGYRDKDGYWTGLALVPAGFLVNNDVLKEKGLEAPKTWEDLADPKYKDEIIMASPAISGTQYAILNGTLQAWGEEKGWEIWTAINDNVAFYAKGGGEPGPKVCAGEYGIGILAMTGGTFALEKEYPVTAVYPEDMIPWTPAPIAIFKNSENKDAAKVFVDYYLSKEGQEALREADARVMARGDVDVPSEIGTVDTTKLIKQDVLLFGSERESLLEKWAELAGEKDS